MSASKLERPTEGGSYIRQADGSLKKQVEESQEPAKATVKAAETSKKRK